MSLNAEARLCLGFRDQCGEKDDGRPLQPRIGLDLCRQLRSLSLLVAGVAELADALDSKSSDRKIVWVRAPPPARAPPVSAGRFGGT